MSTVSNPHVEVSADGHARIRGTGFKVRLLAEAHLATGADAMELHQNHPQLALSQIYGALSYYYDHKDEFDREIEELHQLAEDVQSQQGDSVLAAKLRALGRDVP